MAFWAELIWAVQSWGWPWEGRGLCSWWALWDLDCLRLHLNRYNNYQGRSDTWHLSLLLTFDLPKHVLWPYSASELPSKHLSILWFEGKLEISGEVCLWPPLTSMSTSVLEPNLDNWGRRKGLWMGEMTIPASQGEVRGHLSALTVPGLPSSGPRAFPLPMSRAGKMCQEVKPRSNLQFWGTVHSSGSQTSACCRITLGYVETQHQIFLIQ